MKYQKLCEDIIERVGGKENVISVTHCVTRLRFKLKDESKADEDALVALDGVMKVMRGAEQYQVVIGTHVDNVYKELIQIGGFQAAAPVEEKEEKEEKKGAVNAFLNMMMGLFAPVLGVLTASGMIKGLLALLSVTGAVASDSGTYVIMSAIGDSLFYFFPIVLGYSSAKRFGLNEVMGMTLGGVLVYPTMLAYMGMEPLYYLFEGTMFESAVYAKLFGIPIMMQNYNGSVIPVIMIVYVGAKISKALSNVIPSLVKNFFVPFLTLLITAPLGLAVIGPIASVLQAMLGELVVGLIGLNAGIAGFLIGTFWSVLVIFGLHWGILPLSTLNLSTYGFDVIKPCIFAGAVASAAAAAAVMVRTKSAKAKLVSAPAALSSIFGVNEPTLYGVLIPRKKIMISTFISAGIGGAIAGLSGSKMYSMAASGPLGLPNYIDPVAGVDSGFIGLCIGAVVSIIVSFVAAFILIDTKKGIDAPDEA